MSEPTSRATMGALQEYLLELQRTDEPAAVLFRKMKQATAHLAPRKQISTLSGALAAGYVLAIDSSNPLLESIAERRYHDLHELLGRLVNKVEGFAEEPGDE